ncbi:3-isopropylmalate dehydrogenase [Psychrobacter sp. I-STPA10]|uniref:3-isopropylmalate dehydrogenase n=1 Tax=Psychrobacter sp. I-STPA10 TaxID=2585769 RepID=UPI001E4C41A2|nr:3-isopropylmalate dehydrogenase [Psychrobacter sp. I-STPA10]
MKVLALAGDGIGTEVMAQAINVLQAVNDKFDLQIEIESGLIGGVAVDATGEPLPDETLDKARAADAILLGAVGGPKWDQIERSKRPERGLLKIRSELGLFANLRVAKLYPQLINASSIRAEVISGLDLLIVRELTGGIYFGEPRGIRTLDNGEEQGYNTMVYSSSEIERIGRVAFDLAQTRAKVTGKQAKLCSVDKANVLEVTELWKQTMNKLQASDYNDVELTHMYADNACMQLIKNPKQFDVMVTGNMFGDILSDEAAMLTGSIGMLPSASLDENGKGMYEPCHGSAPDIAGQDKANPLATILSVAMMLRYTFKHEASAQAIEQAVSDVLEDGLRTGDILDRNDASNLTQVGCQQMGAAVLAKLQ